MTDQIHDLPLTPDTAHPIADFLTAARHHHEGRLTTQQVRDRWRAEGWGRFVPAGLAREMMKGGEQ